MADDTEFRLIEVPSSRVAPSQYYIEKRRKGFFGHWLGWYRVAHPYDVEKAYAQFDQLVYEHQFPPEQRHIVLKTWPQD